MHATAYVHAYVPYHNAGAETTLHDLLRAMVQDGWTVDVILSRQDKLITGPYQIDGVSVYPFTDKRQIIRAANKSQLMLTHLECTDRTVSVGRTYRFPVAQLIHNNMDITKGYVAQGADLVVWNTDWVAEDFNYDGLQCIVHPRVDGDRFKFPKGHRKANQEYITLVNLWAGSIKGQNGKGPEVFYALAERFPDHKFLGVIGGYGEQDIRNLPNVTIQKHTPDMVKDVYAKTKVLLMPSRYESFGRVALEGAFLGIPTIANPTLGLTEALGSGGIYADRDDSAAWAMALEDLLEPDIYKKASDYAKTRAKFWKSKQSAELETFLRHAWHLGQQCLLLRGW